MSDHLRPKKPQSLVMFGKRPADIVLLIGLTTRGETAINSDPFGSSSLVSLQPPLRLTWSSKESAGKRIFRWAFVFMSISTWWHIPQIVNGWVQPSYKWDKLSSSTHNWGERTHFRFVGWSPPQPRDQLHARSWCQKMRSHQCQHSQAAPGKFILGKLSSLKVHFWSATVYI